MKEKKINNPRELRKLKKNELKQATQEIRKYLLESVSKSSGHFASGLGSVELAVAVHYAYNTPFDKIIWDVGHQCYPHKIITERRDKLGTIRKIDGLHPFPSPKESEYDAFGVGHSSTSISAALGMAIAAETENKNRKVVAIIGDGALTGGMAFEALNQTGEAQKDMLIILNDNKMSISENVGALNKLLSKTIVNENHLKIKPEDLDTSVDIQPTAEATSNNKNNIFTKLGIAYHGPLDGHDVETITDALQILKNSKGTQMLHLVTKKGKGYSPAEENPIKWHAVKKFQLQQTNTPKTASAVKKETSYSNIFGNWLCKMAAQDQDLIAITPAMSEGSGMKEFAVEFPKQHIDTGIAEQHAITLAAGLAISKKKIIVAIYSTFLQRGYDQLIHDVAIQKLPVTFAIDRAGIVGGDGATHQGAFDISFLRCIPNLIIMTPSDGSECCNMLYTAYQAQQPVAVRYPKANCSKYHREDTYQEVAIGKAKTIRIGNKIAILNFGTMLETAKELAEELDFTLIDMRFVKPIDSEAIKNIANTHEGIVTIEENSIKGGAGTAVIEELMRIQRPILTLNIGLPDYFIEHGDIEDIKIRLGLDKSGIKEKITKYFFNN